MGSQCVKGGDKRRAPEKSTNAISSSSLCAFLIGRKRAGVIKIGQRLEHQGHLMSAIGRLPTSVGSVLGHEQNFAIAFISLRRESAAGPQQAEIKLRIATSDERFSRCGSLALKTRSSVPVPRVTYVEIFDTVDETSIGLSG